MTYKELFEKVKDHLDAQVMLAEPGNGKYEIADNVRFIEPEGIISNMVGNWLVKYNVDLLKYKTEKDEEGREYFGVGYPFLCI